MESIFLQNNIYIICISQLGSRLQHNDLMICVKLSIKNLTSQLVLSSKNYRWLRESSSVIDFVFHFPLMREQRLQTFRSAGTLLCALPIPMAQKLNYAAKRNYTASFRHANEPFDDSTQKLKSNSLINYFPIAAQVHDSHIYAQLD